MRTTSGFAAVCLVALSLSFAPRSNAQALPQPTSSPEWSGFQNPPPNTPTAPNTPPPAAPANAMPGPPPLPPEAPPSSGVSSPSEFGPPPVVTSTPGATVPPPPPPAAPGVTPAPVPADAAATPVVVSEREIPGPVATPGTAGMKVGDPKAVRLTSSYFGSVGVYNVIAAEAGEPLVLRFAIYGSYFNKSDFPVVGANTEQEIGQLSMGFSPLRWFDLYAGTRVAATNSTGTSGTNPSFISELGDFWGGVKFGGFVAKTLALGLDLRGEGYSGVGTTGIAAGAFVPTGVITFDFAKIKFPMRLHLNIGGQFGNLNVLAPTNAAGSTVPLTAPEQFALGWTNYQQLRGGAALEFPFPYVTPFVEYTIVYPINAQNLYDPAGNPVSVGSTLPQQIDFGFRVTALRDVSFLVGGSGTLQQNVAVGVPILPYWTVFGGLTYNVELAPHGPTRILETRTTETAMAAQPSVHGTVFEADTKAPIAGALVQSSIADQGPVATNALGQFQSYPTAPGPVDFTISKDGYKAASAHAVIEAGVPTPSVDVPLVREAKAIVLHVNVHGAHGGHMLAATVNFTGPQAFQQDLSIPATGSGDITLPAPGRYELKITSKGHLAQEHHVEVNLGQNTFDLVLLPEPAKSSLIIKGKTILLKRQIHFQGGSAKILPDSSTLLAEIASYIVIHNVSKMRVEGFTDNTGGKARNLKLSQDRADAVMQHLIDDGIPAEKLEAVGYGDQKPVAPNLTARGRALNRRVEFLILQ